MSVVDPITELVVSQPVPHERGDAARNRLRLLDAARKLIAEHGADAVSMDDVAAAAGVGKGTLFRRFGSRAGLMMVLLDEDEKCEQQAILFGPPPLGPGAPPLDRLLAYGAERIKFVARHLALLSDAYRDPQTRFSAVFNLHRAHVRMLLEAAGTTGNLDAQTDALLGLLAPDHIAHQLADLGQTVDTLAQGWQSVTHKLCGT